MQKDIYVCFIDYEKAFDKVKHKDFFECLDKAEIDGKDMKIFSEIYVKLTATVRIKGK